MRRYELDGLQTTSAKSVAFSTVALICTVLCLPTVGVCQPGVFTVIDQELGLSLSRDVGIGDVDGDSDLDVIIPSATGSRIWLNDGNGTFTASGDPIGTTETKSVCLGDLDGDNDLDVYLGNATHDQERGFDEVWLNDGSGLFLDSGQRLSQTWTYDVSLGDIDADGDLDALLGKWWDGCQVWLNDGSGVFSDSGQRLGGWVVSEVGLADLDGDGDLDGLMTAFARYGANAIWINDGHGTFTEGCNVPSMSYFEVGDLDGDGDLDLLGEWAYVYLNDGAANFTTGTHIRHTPDRGINDFALGDVDGDGDLDVLFAKTPAADDDGEILSTGSNTVWLNDGTARFTDSGQRLAPFSRSLTLALDDLDHDGDMDVFVVNVGPNHVYLNQSPVPMVNHYQTFDVVPSMSATTQSGAYTWNYTTRAHSWSGDRLGPYSVERAAHPGHWVGHFLYDYDEAHWAQGLHSVLLDSE